MNTYRVPEPMRAELSSFLHNYYDANSFEFGDDDGGTFLVRGSVNICNIVHAFVDGWKRCERSLNKDSEHAS